MLTFLLIVHALVAASLVAVILMQQSEGGGLASSGSPAGLMSARGASNFLTRSTAILASVFVVLSIGIAALTTLSREPSRIDTSLSRKVAPQYSPAPPPADNSQAIPLAK